MNLELAIGHSCLMNRLNNWNSSLSRFDSRYLGQHGINQSKTAVIPVSPWCYQLMTSLGCHIIIQAVVHGRARGRRSFGMCVEHVVEFFFFFFDFAKDNCTLELVIDKCGIQKRSIFERTAVCLRKARGGQSAVTLNFNCLCCTGGVAWQHAPCSNPFPSIKSVLLCHRCPSK